MPEFEGRVNDLEGAHNDCVISVTVRYGSRTLLTRRTLPVLGALTDPGHRKITYLRVSLTDRCNYRCTYCMPETGVPLLPRSDILSFEELVRLIGVFAGLGVRRLRLTGGEP